MEPIILNTNLEAIHVLDSFESFLWTERYSGHGEFELYIPATDDLLNKLQQDYYVTLKESDKVMIIEDRRIEWDAETGAYLIISGKSLESIPDRRVILEQTAITGNLQNGIQTLLNESIISPTDVNRTISNFIFTASADTDITSLTIDTQYLFDNLYSVIKEICDAENLGFKITLNTSDQFVFELYSGKDRSYNQLTLPYVVFSPDFDNILNGEYENSKSLFKTFTISAGEGTGPDRITEEVTLGQTGINRREVYTDARDISQTVDGSPISEADYKLQLAQRGSENLTKYEIDENFDAEVDTTLSFKYEEDFFLGDIVQITGQFGIEGTARVVEIVRSHDLNGEKVYPRFKML